MASITSARRAPDGLVEPSIFRNRGYTSGTLVLLFFFTGMIGFTFVLSLFLQIGQGFSALHAGLSFAPWSAGLAVGAGFSGGFLAPRYGRRILEIGGLVTLAGTALVAVEARSGMVTSWDILPGLVVAGIGMGLIVAPLFDIIIAAVQDRELGSASGVLNAVQQLAGAVGVAVLGTIFFDAIGRGHFHRALERAIWVDVAVTAAAIALMPLMPVRARPESESLPEPADVPSETRQEAVG